MQLTKILAVMKLAISMIEAKNINKIHRLGFAVEYVGIFSSSDFQYMSLLFEQGLLQYSKTITHVFELTEKAKKFAAEYTEEEMLAVLQTIPEFKMDS